MEGNQKENAHVRIFAGIIGENDGGPRSIRHASSSNTASSETRATLGCGYILNELRQHTTLAWLELPAEAVAVSTVENGGCCQTLEHPRFASHMGFRVVFMITLHFECYNRLSSWFQTEDNSGVPAEEAVAMAFLFFPFVDGWSTYSNFRESIVSVTGP